MLINLSIIKLFIHERFKVEKTCFVPAIDEAGHAVELTITLVASEILPSILDGSQAQNDTNGNDGHLWLESIHCWNKVEHSQAEEINIGDPMELFQQVHRDEGPDAIFCCLDTISCIVSVGMIFRFLVLVKQVGY